MKNILKNKIVLVLLAIFLVLLVGIAILMVVSQKVAKKQVENVVSQEQNQSQTVNNESAQNKSNQPEEQSNQRQTLPSKEQALQDLKNAFSEKDFEKFASELGVAYKNQWAKENDFQSIESQAYMFATEQYFDKGEIQKALDIANIVYPKSFEGWRFKYLRIRCLEKLGRDAFSQNDLVGAEKYASQILQMSYRIEGANLIADVYIKKIESAIAAGNNQLATESLKFIWDYEVGRDRRDKLIQFATQLNFKLN
jgi:type II secretory pathway pseudopilin PulG